MPSGKSNILDAFVFALGELSGNKFEGDVLRKSILLENMPENEIRAQKEFVFTRFESC